jgi:hypothetical protein
MELILINPCYDRSDVCGVCVCGIVKCIKYSATNKKIRFFGFFAQNLILKASLQLGTSLIRSTLQGRPH